MTLTKIIAIILSLTGIVIVVSLIVFGYNNVSQWLQKMSVDLILAIVMAAIAGFAIDQIYKKYSPQSKILKTTVTHNPANNISMAQLILPNNNNIVVNGVERIIGREDFVGIVTTDKLLFIGKDHLKITKEHDSFYIQDMNTKNGTMLNDEDLLGSEKKVLTSGDEILIGKTLKVKYHQKNS
jgi:pSer/pThr/pTyr-binding forkhead associated (FHA) protein